MALLLLCCSLRVLRRFRVGRCFSGLEGLFQSPSASFDENLNVNHCLTELSLAQQEGRAKGRALKEKWCSYYFMCG